MAIENIFFLDVDIKQKIFINEPRVTQNDEVTYILRVVDDGIPFDLSNVTVFTLVSVRPDNQSVQSLGAKTASNEVTFKLGTTEIAVPGRVDAAIQLYDADGRVSSIPFTYTVLKDPVSGYIPSKNEKTLIQLVLTDGPRILSEAEQATSDAIAATELTEQATLEVNAEKNATELVRQATESERLATAAERESTEAERLATEQIRVDTLAIKNDTESVRLATETVRTETLAIKNNTETVKDETDLVRQATETERLATVEVKNATDTVRQETLTVKNAAVTATTEANTARVNADLSAVTANAAGVYANTQGKRAENAADLVDVLLDDGTVASVNGQTGVVTITPENIGAGKVKSVNDIGPDSNGNVEIVIPDPDLSGLATKQELQTETQARTTHMAEDGSLTKKGHVQLNSSVTSISEVLAATPKAVKTAMDRADAAFTSANNGKAVVGNAIVGVDPNVVIPTDPTFQQIADAVRQINTGKKFASGLVTSSTTNITHVHADGTTQAWRFAEVSGLPFKPSVIILTSITPGQTYVNQTVMHRTNFEGNANVAKGRITNTDFLPAPTATNTRMLRLDGTASYISDSGFRTYAGISGGLYKWEAYGE